VLRLWPVAAAATQRWVLAGAVDVDGTDIRPGRPLILASVARSALPWIGGWPAALPVAGVDGDDQVGATN
jgi:molybdopterin biosynthesis enzyme